MESPDTVSLNEFKRVFEETEEHLLMLIVKDERELNILREEIEDENEIIMDIEDQEFLTRGAEPDNQNYSKDTSWGIVKIEITPEEGLTDNLNMTVHMDNDYALVQLTEANPASYLDM